jgi:hypothetical protein
MAREVGAAEEADERLPLPPTREVPNIAASEVLLRAK